MRCTPLARSRSRSRDPRRDASSRPCSLGRRALAGRPRQDVCATPSPSPRPGSIPRRSPTCIRRNVVVNIFDTPLTYDYLARPLEARAQHARPRCPRCSRTARSTRMRVKPGIYFADDPAFKGRKRELTAEDYVYSIKRLFDPKRKSPNLYLLEGKIVGMDEVLRRGAPRQPHGLRHAGGGPARARPLHVPGPPEAAQLQLPLLPRVLQPHLRRGARGRRALRRQGRASIPWAPGPSGSRSGSAPRRWCSRRTRTTARSTSTATPPAGDALAQAHLAAHQGQAPADGRPRRGVRSSRSRSRAGSRSSTASTTSSSACRTSSPTSRFPTGALAPNLARRGITLDRKPGMELTYSYFAMKDPVVGGYTPDKVALRRAIVAGQRCRGGDPHPAQEPGDRRAEPDRPRRGGLRPGLPLHRERVQPGRRPRRCSTCTATSTATATAGATCRARSRRPLQAALDRVRRGARPARSRRWSSCGRRTWTRSASA